MPAAEIKTIDPGGVNCYLLNAGNGFILVDTGGSTMFNQDTAAIRSRLEKALDTADSFSHGSIGKIAQALKHYNHYRNCIAN